MITYPVNQNSLFTFKSGQLIARNQKWPRADGMQLQGVPNGTIMLEQSEGAKPAFDPLTQKLVGAWVDDDVNQTAVWTWSAVALTTQEAAAAQEYAARQAKRAAVAQAIPTLRTWATQAKAVTVTSGNAVAVVQGIVDQLEVFWDRFADLLEATYIDK